MSGYIFNHGDLNGFFNNGDFEDLKAAIDVSFGNILTAGYDSTRDISFVQDAYSFSSYLKNENKTKIDILNTTLSNIKDKQNNIDFELKDNNVKKIKNRVSQNNKQNSENIKAFLETYLYLIVKIIFIFFLFVLVYNYSGISFFAFSFSELYGNLKNKINEVKTTGSEIQNKINNKIEKIKENRGNKEKSKSNVLNNFNNENYVEIAKPKTPKPETLNSRNSNSRSPNSANPQPPSS